MKSALSVTLVTSLAGSLSVAAQVRATSTAGPIASSVNREASRLAGDRQSDTPDADWSRVRTLAPGTEVFVTVKGTPPEKRYFVAAAGSDLTVLNLTDPALSGYAAGEIRALASNHPEYFTAQTGVFRDRGLRVGPDSVFVDGRKVADLARLVERVARADVVEIGSPVRTRGSTGVTIAAMAAGLAAGFFLLESTIDCPFAGNCGAWQVRRAAPVWLPIASGFVGYRASAQEVGGVIYRAP